MPPEDPTARLSLRAEAKMLGEPNVVDRLFDGTSQHLIGMNMFQNVFQSCSDVELELISDETF